eukprot:gene4907-8496_t
MKSFDFYPKTLEDFKIQTSSGAIISITSLVIISILFLSEFYFYLQYHRNDALFVDVSEEKKIEVYINMTFPSISCAALSLDVVDVAGELQIGVQKTIYKRRLDLKTGEPLDAYKLEVHTDPKTVEEKNKIIAKIKSKDYCGPCYGAATSPKQCCNTCDSVREAYQRKGWGLTIGDDVEQCTEENFERKQKYSALEGCNLHGYILVNKVAGNIHLIPGKSTQTAGGISHEYTSYEIEHFNTSHIIHSLGFGEKYPGLQNPLDGVKRIIPKGSGLFQYFVKVVPTIYELSGSSEVIKTNQYSVTQHFRPHNEVHKNVVPGVFLIYDLSPIMVHITETRKSFLHFITNLCAVIGGVFTIAGILDTVVYNVMQKMNPKTLSY